MGHAIEFVKVVKRFPGTLALNEVSFSIEPGEIHAIVGANGAGKSTLMNILGGQYKQDAGDVILNGRKISFASPQASRAAGIGVVYQELKLCENLNVAQNIFLGNEIKNKFGSPDMGKMINQSYEILKKLDETIDPRQKVSTLSIGKRQLVEIARALFMKASIIILDEPTSSLSTKDTERLFSNITALKQEGITVLFISHRMEEIFRISDRISVMRDGSYLGTFDKNQTKPEEIVDLIAGKQLSEELAKGHAAGTKNEEVVLDVQSLLRGKLVKNVSFKLHKGEILGIYGLQGAGRSELIETLFGLEKSEAGTVSCFGEAVTIRKPSDAIKLGIALISEDRRRKGIFPNFDIRDNIAVVKPDGVEKSGFIQTKIVERFAQEAIRLIGIKATSTRQKIVNLSGGNQQKVLISRWLSKKPRILLLDEVSRGIDVGSKAEIFKTIRKFRDDGMSILFISSEIEEILAECDRTLVMHNGSVVAAFTRDAMDKVSLIRAAMGY